MRNGSELASSGGGSVDALGHVCVRLRLSELNVQAEERPRRQCTSYIEVAGRTRPTTRTTRKDARAQRDTEHGDDDEWYGGDVHACTKGWGECDMEGVMC